jgi:hypothetical protein
MMKRNYEAFVHEISALPDYERHDFLMACIRSLLQTVVLCLVDILAEQNEEDELLQELAKDPDQIFTNDSAPIPLIDKLLTKLRVARDEMICPSWKKERMESWASYRNTICHGVPGRPLVKKAISDLERLVAQLLDIFEPILPENGRKNRLGAEIRSLPREYGGTPVVFRQSTRIFPLEVESASKRFEFHETSIFGIRSTNDISCKRYTFSGKECRVRLPEKPEFFMFRKKSLETLSRWWNSDNKNVVLIQANGGMGKTTLLLKFLYNFIEASEDFLEDSLASDAGAFHSYTPRIVCFSTAKKTIFGLEGVIHRDPDAATLDTVAKNLFDMIDAQPVENCSGLNLWRRLCEELNQHGRDIRPQDVVVAIDNAETMTEDPDGNPTEAAEHFGRHIGDIAQLGFRVLVTSRSDERVEGGVVRIRLDNFNPEESEEFAQKRAGQLAISSSANKGRLKAILDNVPALSRALTTLGGMPLLLDVFVRRIASSGAGLEDTANQLANDDVGDLCDFIYGPAWDLTEPPCQKVLLTIQKIGPCADKIIKQIPIHFGISYEYFKMAIMETDFFESKSLRNKEKDTILKPWATQFLQKKLEESPTEEQHQIENICVKLQQDPLFNDVSLTNASRKALSSWERGDTKAAQYYFKQAWSQEPGNSKLALKYGEFLVEVGMEFPDVAVEFPKNLIEKLSKSISGTFLLARSCIPRQRDRDFDRYCDKFAGMSVHRNDVALLKASYFIESLRILSSQPPVLRQQFGEAEDDWQKRKFDTEDYYIQEIDELRRKIQDNLNQVNLPDTDLTPREQAWAERRLGLENRLQELSDLAG